MALQILILSVATGFDYSFYVKSIATYAPAFLAYNNSVLARVMRTLKCIVICNDVQRFIICGGEGARFFTTSLSQAVQGIAYILAVYDGRSTFDISRIFLLSLVCKSSSNALLHIPYSREY